MPTRLCLEPRCPNSAAYRGRCATHSQANERYTHNRDRKRIYSSKRWQLLRRRVLYEQPICIACDEALATDVDHIVAIEDGGEPWARTNLQALCSPCHSRKTRQEQHT